MTPRISPFNIATFCLQFVIALLGVASCSRSDRYNPETEKAVIEIEDSIRAGHMQFAAERLAELKRSAVVEKDSDLWARLMVQQAVMGYYSDNPTMLKESADSASKWLQRQSPDTTRIALLAKALQCESAYYDRFNYNPDSSCAYLRRSVGMLERLGADRNLSVSYGNFANTMRMTGRLDSAAFYYNRALSLADSLHLAPDDYIALSNGMAAVMTDLRNFDQSKKWWERSMSLLPQMGPFDKFNTLTGYGNDLYYREDYNGANDVFIKLMDYLDSIPEARWERMFTGVNLADTYLRLDKPGKAALLLDSARTYFMHEQPNDVVMSYITTLRMREAWLDGDNTKLQNLIAANPLDLSMRPEQLLARLEFLYTYYAASGQPQKAIDAHFRYDHLLDSMRSSQLRQQISAQDAVYSRDNRILNLQSENDRNQARILRLWVIMALSATVILAIFIAVLIRQEHQKRREERMMSKIMALRGENLRNRITPHFIYNALNHVIARHSSGQKTDLDSIVRLIRHQQTALSDMLVPLSDELAFVEDYVSVMADKIGDNVIYTCDVEDGLDPKEIAFPSMTIQILVENAFKHAFPNLPAEKEKRLSIGVSRTPEGALSVSVRNNTTGMSQTAPGEGNGLRIVLESIRIINDRNHMGISFEVNPETTCGGDTYYEALITIEHPQRPIQNQ